MGIIPEKKKILAVSSSGGHWVQLMRLRPAWDNCVVTYLTTEADYERETLSYARENGLESPTFYTTIPASRWSKFKLLRQLFEVMIVVVRVRPDIIISTGASIGYFSFKAGRILGAKTLWIDSIANVEKMSLAGVKARKSSDAWLTQWPHLATGEPNRYGKGEKPDYWGASL